MSNVYLALRRSVGFLLLLFCQVAIAQPVINSFSPTAGRVGTLVTISGTGFSPQVDSNIVYIGAVRAYVTTASTTSLTVIVPAAATYAPITVTSNRLTAYSQLAFNMTNIFGHTPFDTTSFARDLELTGLGNPRNLVFADFNRDGRSDIFVTNQSLNTGSVFRNTTSGRVVSWATPKSIWLGNEPFGIATGDLNGDGKLDVAVVNAAAGLASTVSVLNNTSVGDTIRFDTTNYATGNGSRGVAIADVDADGKPDLVTTSSNSGWISVFRNTTTTYGSITFAAREDLSTFDRADEVVIRDLDNDGKPEIVTANFMGSISVWKNLSSPGSLLFFKTNFTALQYPTGIAIGDMNGDGKPDIVLSHYGSPVLSVFRNTSSTGNISLDTRRDFPVDGNSRGISLGDLNGDGKTDVAVVSDSTDVLTLLQNASAGDTILLTNRYDFAVEAGPTGVAIGDLNADGMVDIAATNSYSKISIFRNTQIGTPPVINSFTPTAGTKGTLVTIHGSHFTGATLVRFGNVLADSIVYISDTVIRAIVDTGSSGAVGVYTPAGAAFKTYFTYIPLIDSTSPVVTNFSPKTGIRGTVVTIFGKRLATTTSVRFGGVPADSVIVLSDTVIRAIVDTGATGMVTVFTTYGGVSVPGFTFIRDTTPPVITSFTPTSARKGNMVTIFGQRFTGATSVKFGGVPAKSMMVLADTVIRAFIDTGATGNVSITTPYGTASKAGFTFIVDTVYLPDSTGLAITSFSPVMGRKGDVVTIFGKQFTGVNAVRFGGVLAESMVVLSDTVIRATVGNGATGAVTVYKGLRYASGLYFWFVPDTAGYPFPTSPVITSFTPTSGSKGTVVTIFGNRFTGTTAVQFGGVPADSVVVLSDSVLQARVSTGATGNVRVFTTGGLDSRAGFTFIADTTVIDTLYTNARVGNNNASAKAKPFVLYPNPASQYVIWQQPVTGHVSRLRLIDINGRIVKTIVIGKGASQITIPVSELHTGVYQLLWSDGNTKVTRSLLIK